MEDLQTWRDLLGQIIRDPQEEQRLCDVLGVRSITLIRWSTGESDPRPRNLSQLLNALPTHREQFIKLIDREKGSLLVQEDVFREIPSTFYAHVMRTLKLTPESVRFWSICHAVLPQALQQFDPERLGLDLSVIRCMSGDDGHIHSLRESVGIGTAPWRIDFAERHHFLGVESLPGYVVSSGHHAAIQRLEDNDFLPTYPSTHAASLAASPISLTGKIAGCLLVSSAIPSFFVPARIELINAYADLLILAFEREDFVDQKLIKLFSMPSFQEQQPYLTTFNHRVAQVLRTYALHEEMISKEQAEEIVRREFEKMLIAQTQPRQQEVERS